MTDLFAFHPDYSFNLESVEETRSQKDRQVRPWDKVGEGMDVVCLKEGVGY